MSETEDRAVRLLAAEFRERFCVTKQKAHTIVTVNPEVIARAAVDTLILHGWTPPE